MESHLHQNHHNIHPHQQQQQMNSGLMRYRSAPSSYFANFLDNEDCEEFLHPRPPSPETERIFAGFISGDAAEDPPSHNLCEIQQNSPVTETVANQQTPFMASMKQETEVIQPQQNGFCSASQMIYQSPSQSPLPNHSSAASAGSAMESPYRVVNPLGMDRLAPMKMGGSNNSNLIRHSSSPAGLFSHINIENGYVALRGMGNLGAGNGTNGEPSFSSASRLKNQINFSSGPPTSSGLMTPISEMGNKSMGQSSPDSGSFGEGRSSNGGYITGFPIGSWDDSTIMSENFTGLKRARGDDRNAFSGLNALEAQNGDAGKRAPSVLSHHLSLPKTSAEMAAMEKFMQFQDSVPCKIRAKRGCATHPRSIAERVRRTRISERMRKLQELVPNMDKQTNTSDMLDLAVDYIKELQKQVKTLSENRAKCTCSSKKKP
ncbi:hypothetical protein L1049_017838 [Liquidambar formosana]|uniref:BHLH domain-containing protein n=1 Tax=Liquidambar formosana TaxID=63359 RepID=A0AAP0R9L2_LIQFO